MKLNPQNKLDCTVHNGRECVLPRNWNPWNGRDRPSTKIEPRENFLLYSITQGWVFQAFDITAEYLSEAYMYIATLAKITGNIMEDLSTMFGT